MERDERERKEREQREKEKAEAALQGDKKPKAAPKKAGKGKEEKKDGPIWIPPERRPVVDWACFISHVEPFYKDNRIEEEEIMRAFRVFDREGKGWIHRDELVKILTTKGEDILAPPEVETLKETFPNSKVDFREFAQKMQGTWVEPKESAQDSMSASRSTARAGTAGEGGTPRTEAATARSNAGDGAATGRTDGAATSRTDAADSTAASTTGT
jgi:hypothetical protein